MNEDWIKCSFDDLLKYEQPTNYIVKSTDYNNKYETPVLTAGKSFIKGYTNEEEGIFDNLPTIIFDDFTTASQFVNFPFKVKSSAMKILIPTSNLVNLKFAYYYMLVHKIRSDTHKRYWISVYSKKNINLPPLPIQRAIVAKIEEFFSSLDSGIADLKKALEQLKIYRKAILKKAFEGKLTEDWRRKQPNLLSGEKVLYKINEERDKKFEKDLANWKEDVRDWEINGKEGRKPKKPRRLDNSTMNDYQAQFETPDSWIKCQLADVISDLTDYHANGSYEVLKKNVTLVDNSGYAVMVRATNFEKNDFTKELKFVDEHGYKFLKKSQLFGNEILIGKIGNAGRVYLMPILNRKASLAMNLFALRVNNISSQFLYYQLKNFYQEKEIKSYVRGVGNPTIDKISIRSIHINICSQEEQLKIVQEIESKLNICNRIKIEIEESVKKSEALRKSILKKAFEGKLLSEEELDKCKKEQDYEPAEDLLKKIKAEQKK